MKRKKKTQKLKIKDKNLRACWIAYYELKGIPYEII